MAPPPYIQIQNVTKRFGKKIILNDLNLDIPFGEVTGIIGASGSGKTTLLNLLIGFMKPDKGTIFFQSRDIFKDMKNVSTIFGFGAQACSFYFDLSVEENLIYFGKLYGLKSKDIKKRIPELLELIELKDARRTLGKQLSTGMKRRLDIACALIHEPKVLILDEPTEELDPILRKGLINTIRRIRNSGKTVIVTSHLLNEIERLCDDVAILNEGRIVAFDTPANLKKKYSKIDLDDVFEVIIKQSRLKKQQPKVSVEKEPEKKKTLLDAFLWGEKDKTQKEELKNK